MRLLQGSWMVPLIAIGGLVSHNGFVQAQGDFDSQLRPCPAACDGSPSTNWTLYSSLDRIHICDQPILMDFALHTPLDDPSRLVKLFACTAGDANVTHNALATHAHIHDQNPHGHDQVIERSSTACSAGKETKVSLRLTTSAADGSAEATTLDTVLGKVQGHLSDASSCDITSVFGYMQGAAVGIYSGSAIDNLVSATSLIQRLRDRFDSGRIPKSIVVELCDDARNSGHVLGISIETTGDMAAVQESVSSWSEARCADRRESSTKLTDINILEMPLASFSGNVASQDNQSLQRRANCRAIKVVSGDSCGSLASKCGISGAQFTKFNPRKSLCSTLTVGERVCCSEGTLPDITPKMNPDGSCASYKVKSGDTCSSIAASNGLEVSDIQEFNDKTTWGWFGCNDLQFALEICLSQGTPPMPASVSNAICGPTKPGTKKPTEGQKLSILNPCPLNACCDIWGQCGITPDFCNVTTGPTGNPGTAPNGKNGCISHCGTNLANGNRAPSAFMNVGYYESWNFDRPCLNLDVASIGIMNYTHVHWAFAALDATFSPVINNTYNQWDKFMSLEGMKKVVSFGGWGFSTDPSTYDLLRKAMDSSNVDTFVSNVVKFVESKGLDGVDFDWEYPGAPDIAGVPPGLKTDGPNYLTFLKKLKTALPSSVTLSIAAPASFWYLKAFPIQQMSQHLDYIVFMTYDLHGQWDYGNSFSQNGCPAGNCLRSHVNLTETNWALAMITKAGVPTNQIVVGVSSYGRSFGMSQAGCTGPSCTFVGPKSGAKPGQCTGTAGILANAEIQDLVLFNNFNKTWYDAESDANFVTYDNKQWVSYMTDDTRASRVNRYQGHNFAGSVDWAIDLAQWSGDSSDPNATDDLPPAPPLSPCTASFDSLDNLGNSAGSIPTHCTTQYTVSTLNKMLAVAMKNYTSMMNNGYDSKFNTYANAVADSAGSAVHKFVYNNGDKYFSCTVTEFVSCCDKCSMSGETNPCAYCFKEGKCYVECHDPVTCGRGPSPVMNYKFVNESEPCPPDYSKRGPGDGSNSQTVYWKMEPGKSDAFYAALLSNTGIPKNKTEFGFYDRTNDCMPSAKPGDSCYSIGMDFNIPIPNGYSASDVQNPKTVVQKALQKSGSLGPQIDDLLYAMSVDAWNGNGFDLIDSVSLPIIMIVDAVENMEQVVTVANKIDEEKKKELIMLFLTAILFFIPIAGEVAGAAGLTDLGTVLAIGGGVGNAAFDVYNVVEDPSNAPLAIMSLILAPASLAEAANIARAAKITRSIDDAHLAKLGGMVAEKMGSIRKVTGRCNT